MVTFESTILKIIDHGYVLKSFATTTGNFDNGIWKTPYNWIFYGDGSAYGYGSIRSANSFLSKYLETEVDKSGKVVNKDLFILRLQQMVYKHHQKFSLT